MMSSVSNNGIRLQKYLSLCGISSRRKSEEIINAGRVKVNGEKILNKGHRVFEGDIVELDGKQIKPEQKIYIVLNKPAGYLCSHLDKFGRKTIYDILKIKNFKLFSAGRLDYNSKGLLIISNDGDFINKITHPKFKIIKEYYVETKTSVPKKLCNEFTHGIVINNEKYKALSIKKLNDKLVSIKLQEGKKREIRNVFKFFKIQITSLTRVSIGNLKLENLMLKEGEYKFFSKEELSKLIFS